jgi:hypothetical protein
MKDTFYFFYLMKKTFYYVPVILSFLVSCESESQQVNLQSTANIITKAEEVKEKPRPAPILDTVTYNNLIKYMSNGDSTGRWPVKNDYPKVGAILPFKRIVSYYGNLYSKQMGILGELPKDSMLKKLQGEVKKWTQADSLMPAIPALHYIAVTAQSSPGAAGKYRLRMPFHQIDTVINWAKTIDALVFIDIQVGLSTIQQELPEFERYLAMPQVHLGIDPEFSMKTGAKPGSVIGTYDAADINYVTNYLAEIVKKYDLPPKVLVIHRFTQGMVTNYKQIKLRPEVQIVMDMDGWGNPAKKIGTYKQFIYPQPVQFTGFKLFYKNDTKKVGETKVMQPDVLMKLTPKPVYIQYQ